MPSITISPIEEGEFADITLASEDVEITKNTANWTFTMPEADVAVDVVYVEPVQTNTFHVGFIPPLTDSDWELTWNNTTNNYAVQDPDTGIYTCSTGDEISLVMDEGYTFDLESQTADTKLKLGGVDYVPQQDVPRSAVFTVSEDLDLTVEVYAEPEPYSPQLGDILNWENSNSGGQLYGTSEVTDTGAVSGYVESTILTSSATELVPVGSKVYALLADAAKINTQEAIQMYSYDGENYAPIPNGTNYISTQ